MLEENPSVEVVIDLHRDGVPDDKHLVTDVNGKPTAKIMFFNGLSRTNQNGILNICRIPTFRIIWHSPCSLRFRQSSITRIGCAPSI